MLKFEVNGKYGTVLMNLPTKLSEITPEYLNEVTSNVVVADNYSLIGILYRESLASVILANNRKQKNITTAIVPIFIKSGVTNTEYIKQMSCGDKIIIAPSDIAIGHHVTCPKNKITINNILDYCDGDKEAYQRAIGISQACYYLEFKIVPNCNIHGNYIEENSSYQNPFIEFNSDTTVQG
uniref:Uncharacterized protein n=1 Tax=Geladintestivirus 5 TaxID=3233137 RepID=A0AAU8MIY3_9CAUD